jgi:hypothetical protein
MMCPDCVEMACKNAYLICLGKLDAVDSLKCIDGICNKELYRNLVKLQSENEGQENV